MSTISFYEAKKREIKSQIDKEEERHKSAMDALRHEYVEAGKQVEYLCADIDTSRVLQAEHVISVRGLYCDAGDEKGHVIEKAISELLKGGGILFKEYLGTKDYDRWHGQYIECDYGFSPRHGAVIFRVELTRAILEQKKPLTQEQIDDAIYYLHNLERIQKSEQKAVNS